MLFTVCSTIDLEFAKVSGELNLKIFDLFFKKVLILPLLPGKLVNGLIGVFGADFVLLVENLVVFFTVNVIVPVLFMCNREFLKFSLASKIVIFPNISETYPLESLVMEIGQLLQRQGLWTVLIIAGDFEVLKK